MSADSVRRFASRGGDKLDGALDALTIDVQSLRALDAGSSTGGFTDCLLSRGAREVIAVDVAYGALDWRIRTDPRVRVLERTNVRTLTPELIDGTVDLVVADLSFISLRTVADALVGCCGTEGMIVVMVKPQFELPRGRVPRGGVVRDMEDREEACGLVADAFRERGFVLAGAVASQVPGPKGNREFFLHALRSGEDVGDAALRTAVRDAP